MTKFLSFIKSPKVSHTLAVVLGAAASYFATGHIDLSQLIK